ncbi:MAG: hypothetical protein R3F11_12875 [Verrucomicrobiales bacterium]
MTEAQSMKVLYAATGFRRLGRRHCLRHDRREERPRRLVVVTLGTPGGMLSLFFLLGIIAKRAKNPAAIATSSLILIVLWGAASEFLPNAWQMPLHASLIPVIATLAIPVVGAAIAKIAQKRPTTTK